MSLITEYEQGLTKPVDAPLLMDVAPEKQGFLQRRKKSKLLGLFAIGTMGYGAFFGADAKVGPVPMPQPIEFIVDWNNAPDHKAEGFPKPDGAAELSLSNQVVSPPLLTDYDTSGAPDALYEEFVFAESVTNPANIRRQVRPGLWEVKYSLPYTPRNGEKDVLGNGCIALFGNFTDGRTSVFTQDVGTEVGISVLDADVAMICGATDNHVDGSVFVHGE